MVLAMKVPGSIPGLFRQIAQFTTRRSSSPLFFDNVTIENAMTEEEVCNQHLIGYDLHRAGWAGVSFRAEKERLSFAVSYLHDSLGDLACMALSLHKGAVTAEAVFMDEPGEVILMTTGTKDVLQFELREYRDWASWGMMALEDHKVVARGEIARDALVRNIHAILERIYLEVGLARYRELWVEHEFPLQDYERLSIALHKGR
ncbi:hypothetical protein [Variovorax paradoxus]|jgi:hypothetical protein|uniref:hypothetical protein n=1 Tax=Variovorax paradoxus TaxID=34073 RepID=UPI0029C9A7CC|nr:hypothetical protein RZE77_23280 [Variovorax paradoxus]